MSSSRRHEDDLDPSTHLDLGADVDGVDVPAAPSLPVVPSGGQRAGGESRVPGVSSGHPADGQGRHGSWGLSHHGDQGSCGALLPQVSLPHLCLTGQFVDVPVASSGGRWLRG